MCIRADIAARIPREEDARLGRRLTKRAQGYNPSPGRMQLGFRFPYLFAIPATHPDRIGLFRWGFVPEGIESRDVGFMAKKGLSVRAEDIFSKPGYERAWTTGQRCVVLLNAVYDIRIEHPPGVQFEEVFYRIRRADSQPLAVAGVFSLWNGRLPTVAILTTNANTFFKYTNNAGQRMPVILGPEGEALWLSNTNYFDRGLEELMKKPCPSSWLRIERQK